MSFYTYILESKTSDRLYIDQTNNLEDRIKSHKGTRTKVRKKLRPKHLSLDCQKLLKNAEKVINVNIKEDPNYKLVVDQV